MIKNQTYKLNNQPLTNETLKSYISKFWEDAFKPLLTKGETIHLMILCKVSFDEKSTLSYKTIGPLRRAEYKDLELFQDYLCERLGLIIESYNPSAVSQIVFTYIIKKGKITSNDRVLLKDLTNKELSFHEFHKIRLPISMNPIDYGTVLASSVIENFTRYLTTTNKRIFQLDVLNIGSSLQQVNQVSILGGSDLKWVDTLIDENTFKREIGKSTMYFLNGVLVLQKQQLNFKSFKRFRHE